MELRELEYKGVKAQYWLYQMLPRSYFGKTTNLGRPIDFVGGNRKEAEQNFKSAVDHYLHQCQILRAEPKIIQPKKELEMRQPILEHRRVYRVAAEHFSIAVWNNNGYFAGIRRDFNVLDVLFPPSQEFPGMTTHVVESWQATEIIVPDGISLRTSLAILDSESGKHLVEDEKSRKFVLVHADGTPRHPQSTDFIVRNEPLFSFLKSQGE